MTGPTSGELEVVASYHATVMTPLNVQGTPVTDDEDRTLSALAVLILSELGESHYLASADPLHAFFRFEPADQMRQYHYLYAVLSSVFEATESLIASCNLEMSNGVTRLKLTFAGPELVAALGEIPSTSLCFDLAILSRSSQQQEPSPDTLDLCRSRVVLRPLFQGDTDEQRTPRKVCFSPDGRHLALISMDGEVVVYSCDGFRKMWSDNHCYGAGVWFMAGGMVLASEGMSWVVETGERLKHGTLDVARSARGTWALLRQGDALTIQPLLGAVVQHAAWSHGRPHTAMLSANGQRLALLHDSPVLTLYDTPDPPARPHPAGAR